MQDKIPILVLVKAERGSRETAQYRILGPAMIEMFDPASRRFMIRGASAPVSDHVRPYGGLESAALLEMRNRLILPFQTKQTRESYVANREARDNAFRRIMLDEYRGQCAVCQAKFLLRDEGKPDLLEASAAHIISVKALGPDDPRNGLSLCPRHHWAFDEGLFAVTDAITIRVSPSVLRAERRKFDLEEYDEESLVAPAHEICRPHEEAISWHRKRVFRAT
jgi:predicted restriction endonuclease